MSLNKSAGKKLLGKTEPRIWTRPLRELTPETSMGYEAIEVAELIGRSLYPWQKWFLIHSLELAPGSYASDTYPKLRYDTVLMLVARQQGKSFTMSTRLLWRMLMWDGPETEAPLILGAAHKLNAAEEILDITTRTLQRSQISDRVARKSNVNGNKYLELENGARYKCEAASDDGGRGLSVTDLAFDELRQQRDWGSWSALTNTTNARYSSQVIAVSNAGESKSVVLQGLRTQALKRIGEWEHKVESGRMSAEEFAQTHDTSMGIFEWSAPEGCDIWDRDGWAQACPSLGHADASGVVLVTEQMLESKAALVGIGGQQGVPEHVFRTENLCQWVTAAAEGPFNQIQIERCLDPDSEIADDSPIALAIDTSHDRSMTYLAVAGYRNDDLPHVEVVAQRAGTEWVAKLVSDGLDFKPDTVVVQGRGAPASSLIEYLEQEGVVVTRCQGNDLTSATSQFSDRLTNGTLRYRDQDSILAGLRDAVKKHLGEVWVWNRARSPVDVAPLCAVTEALWGLETLSGRQRTTVTAYNEEYGTWYDTGQTPQPAAAVAASSPQGASGKGWWE